MKKIMIAVVAAALLAAGVFGGFAVKNKASFKDNFRIDEKSSLNEIVDFYTVSVKNSKDHNNFNLDVTTYVKLDEIECSNLILNGALSAFMGYQVGDEIEETQSFSFENGVDTKNSSATPLSVIQPANSYIESFSEASLLFKSISCKDKYTSLSFEIERESDSLDHVIEAINPILKGLDNVDETAVAALAPKHSEFIDVGNILSTVVDMLGISSMVNNSGSDNNENTSDSVNKTIGIEDGKCYIGATEISADIDENINLDSVIITVPVELNANFRFMSKVIEASICITVIQTYNFSYNDKTV